MDETSPLCTGGRDGGGRLVERWAHEVDPRTARRAPQRAAGRGRRAAVLLARSRGHGRAARRGRRVSRGAVIDAAPGDVDGERHRLVAAALVEPRHERLLGGRGLRALCVGHPVRVRVVEVRLVVDHLDETHGVSD